MAHVLSTLKLMPGYAETSTRKYPVNPDTVILTQAEIDGAVCQGCATIDGNPIWISFKLRGQRRYFFQLRPW